MPIPSELTQYAQWCVSTAHSKVPLDPKTRHAAVTTDPSTWSTYQQAIDTGMPHIGFVLSENDPFAIIDLDDPYSKKDEKTGKRVYSDDECKLIIARQQKVRSKCGTYEELSKSGRGLHLIGYGNLPSGRKRDEIEIYSNVRYIICTGNTITNKPLIDIQPTLDILYNEMEPIQRGELVDVDEMIDDDAVIEMASRAVNSKKFNMLCRGEWIGHYPSQSEADYALISMLAYYTYSNEQVRRLFRMSELGKRPKATKNDSYIDRCLRGIRASQPKPVDLSSLLIKEQKKEKNKEEVKEHVERVKKEQLLNKVPEPPPRKQLEYPPGLLGEVAKYFYESSYKPVREVALASALGFFAGIAGRQYNVSSTGLNQYIILIAGTGIGKEGLSSNIYRLAKCLKKQFPTIYDFIGPSNFASGQGLVRYISKQSCFVSILGEVGFVVEQLNSFKATAADRSLKRALLDLYTKSGQYDVVNPTVYSDSAKDTDMVYSPSVTIVGETVPSVLFDSLSESLIREGLLPRITLIEHTGLRPRKNVNPFRPPESSLIDRISILIQAVLAKQQNNTYDTVQISSEAQIILDRYEDCVDDKINDAGTEPEKQLWNRAHLKVLRYAALLAVADNPHNPVITTKDTKWALEFVNHDVEIITSRVKHGMIGTGDTRRECMVRGAIEDYLAMSIDKRLSGYRIPKSIVKLQAVPISFLSKRLKRCSCFSEHGNRAIRDTLTSMVETEVLETLAPSQLKKLGIRAQVYMPGKFW